MKNPYDLNEVAERIKENERVPDSSLGAGSDQEPKCAECVFGDENIQNAYYIRLEYCVDEKHFDRVQDGTSRPLCVGWKKEPNQRNKPHPNGVCKE